MGKSSVWKKNKQTNKQTKKKSMDSFKTVIKKWNPDACACKICKTYLQNKNKSKIR